MNSYSLWWLSLGMVALLAINCLWRAVKELVPWLNSGRYLIRSTLLSHRR